MGDATFKYDTKTKKEISSWIDPPARVEVEISLGGVAWAGFWIGLGIVLAAGVLHGQVDISGWFK